MTLQVDRITFTDSAISDRIKVFFSQFKKNNSYKYLNMIDSRIIQSQVIEIDFNDFDSVIQDFFKNESIQRLHVAFYRAIVEVSQVRYGSDTLEEFKKQDSVKFKILNHRFFNLKTLSNPKPLRRVQITNIDKEKTVDSDFKEFQREIISGFTAYEEKNELQSFSKDFVGDILLPAHVYNGKESCGKWKQIGCLETDLHSNGVGYVRKATQHCNFKGCRICSTSWIKREANSITNRLLTFCNLKGNKKVYLEHNRSRILLHVIVSIPYEEHYLFLEKKGRQKLREKARKILLKELDVDGGVQIDHPYRFTEKLESARFSPHLHFIVTGWIDGNKVKEIYEKTGWIVTNVSTIDTRKDCYSLSKYLLSHSAVFMKQEGKRSAEHGVRYFGECNNRKFKVESVLKHSITGNEQIDDVIYHRASLMKKKNGIEEYIPLQKVSYTHSIIGETIKDVENNYFEHYGTVHGLAEILRTYIKPETDFARDNPAISQNDLVSMEFFQMRFDYGHSRHTIVQSEYVNIILNPDLEKLCPECSIKMETIIPNEERWTEDQAKFLVDLPENTTVPIDDVRQYDYLKNVGFNMLGYPYFDFEGHLQYDTGIYELPTAIEKMNPKLYWTIRRNVNVQKARYTFKVNNGRCPTIDELNETIKMQKSRKDNESDSILNYMA